MPAFLLQIRAILVVAYKRLLTQRSLALATAVGLTTSVALVLSVPLYADATQFRLLREQLVSEKGAADYAPLKFTFHYDGSTHDGPQWDDAQPVDQYLSQMAGSDLGLPVSLMIRRFRTDSLQIYPPIDPNNPKTKYYITWAHFGFVSQLVKNVRLVSGTFPGVADPSPSAPVEVLVRETTADKLSIQVGDVYYARRDDVEIPVRVTGIWAPADPTLPIWDFKSEETLLVTEETYANRIASTVQDELYNVEWLLVMSGSNLHAPDIDGLLKKIDGVSNQAANLLPYTRLASSPIKELTNYQTEVPALTLLLYAFSAPILGLILVFLGLVSGMFVNQQRNEIAILRSRGATIFQVAGMMALQGLTLGTVALVVGIPIGMLIAHAIGRSRSFLDFSVPANLRVVLTPPILGLGILAIAAVLLFQFIVPTLSAARNTIVAYKQERARAVRPPWWQRAWLDFLLLIPAGYGAYWLYNQRVLAAADKIHVPDPLRNPQLILVPSLGIFALTLFVLRLMPKIVAAIAWLTTRTRSVGLLMASRYLSRTPAFYTAPLVLLVFTLSLSAFTASIAQTLDHHLYKQMYYETGADLTLQEYGNTYNSAENLSPVYTFVPVEDYQHIQGIKAASWVGRYSASVAKADGSQQDAVFLGIDRVTFPQVAYWQSSFSPANLGALMNVLAQYPDGVLVSRDFLKEQGYKLGDTLTLGVKGDRWSTALKTIIVGIVDLFPSWYPEKGPLVVGNIDYLFDKAGSEYPHEIWLKTTPNVDPEEIVYGVRGYTIVIDQSADQARLVQDGLNTFVKGWASATQKIIHEQRRPDRQGLFGLLSVGFVTAALLTVLGFILYALFSFRRRFIELGMLRAVGLSAKQMTALLASELIFLILIGLLVGTALGGLFSQWFIPYLQVGASLSAHYPPFQVEIAWPSIIQMYVLFGLLFLGALSVLAALLLRMKIFQAIKLGRDDLMMSSDPLIICESLIKVYSIAGLEVQALQGLDLTVAPGELMGIVGASGSGKSTLLNILGGLDRPTAGHIWVDNQNLLQLSDQAMNHYRRQTVGFIWQQGTRNLMPYLTAIENVQLPMTLAGNMGRPARERAKMLLELVGLAERQHHHLEQLSGGEQQRVAIALALVNQPKLLLADEPTGEVDNATAQVIYEIFRNLNRELGLTILIVSHDPGVAKYVNRVVAVRDGKLASETMRRVAAEGAETHETMEWVVLDSAGRLQVPKEYLQHFNIKRRAQLELIDRGILIRPVSHPDEPISAEKARAVHGETSAAQTHWWQRWFKSKIGRPS